MMRKLVLLILALVLCAAYPASARYVDGQAGSRVAVIEGRFIVRLTPEAAGGTVARSFGLFSLGVPSLDRVLDQYAVTTFERLLPDAVASRAAYAPKSAAQGYLEEMSRYFIVETPDGVDDDDFMATMRADPNVERIEHDQALFYDFVPNDPEHSQQWYQYESSGRHDIHAHEAWDIERGSDTVVVAVMDTGVLYTHSDLKDAIWINPGEDLDGDEVVMDSTDLDASDNDVNGYVDDMIGYDFVNGTGSYTPWPGEDVSGKDWDPKDFNGHGTGVSGVIAAATNNANGIAGLAGGYGLWRHRGVQIMCLRMAASVVDPDNGLETGVATSSAIAEAITYAANNGADVINYSYTSTYTSALETAVGLAMANGIVFVNSAGNDGADMPYYFGTYDGILSVAATNIFDIKAPFSNYGMWVEVSAPGADIHTTYSSHYSAIYADVDGTSFAAPQVVALAALIKSHFPDYSKSQIEDLILNGADDLDALNPSYAGELGTGRINAYNSLSNAPVAHFESDIQVGPAPLAVQFTDLSPAATSWNWDFGTVDGSMDQNPMYTYTDAGVYDVSLEVTDPNGTDTEVLKRYIFAMADTVDGNHLTTTSGQIVDITFNLRNSLPLDTFNLVITYPSVGVSNLVYQGYSVAGLRGEDFESVELIAHSDVSKKLGLRFAGTPTTNHNAVPPGDGPLVTISFQALGGSSETVTFDTSTINFVPYGAKNRYFTYAPVLSSPSVTLSDYERADANTDFFRNISDAVFIVNHIFKGGPAPPTLYVGDANGDGTFNVSDAVYIINWVFKGGPPPPP
jgi:subtilisin family serine protease